MSNPRRSLGVVVAFLSAASKRLNVNIMCIRSFTFDLFEAAFSSAFFSPGFAWGYSHCAPLGLVDRGFYSFLFAFRF